MISADYTYDALNRPTHVKYDYSVYGNINLTNDITYYYDFSYNSHRISSVQSTVFKPYGDGEIWVSDRVIRYSYDRTGNITKIQDDRNSANETRYVYDDMNQLIREDNVALNETYIFTYDNAGNILTKSVCPLTAEGVTPVPTTTYTYTYGNTEWGDQLTSYNGSSIIYDEIGNPLLYSRGTGHSYFQMIWDENRRPYSIHNGTAQTIYRYNDQGVRISKSTSGKTTYYYVEGTRIISETTDGNIMVYLYDADGSPIGMKYMPENTNADNNRTYYFEKNIQGDIVAVYSTLGYMVASYVYDAWGNFEATYYNAGINDEVVQKNPFLYRGYYYDYETGFYYLNSRYYDPQVGRFISPDSYLSTGQGILGNNMYAYCGNNPVMNVDPNGRSWSEFWEYAKIIASEIGRAMGNAVPAYAGCASITVVDGPIPIADIFAGVVASVITVVAVGYGISKAVPIISEAIEDAKKEAIVSLPQQSQAIFTPNPYDFNPRGLIRNEYPGSKNGKIIKWHDPATNIPVFEWDEDLTYGAHYHILNNGEHSGDHIVPGTIVPEPWNSIYFGG